MSAAQRQVAITLIALLSVVAGVGCGQKGPLVLPDAQRPHRRVPVRSPVQPVTPSAAPGGAGAPSSPAAPADPPPAPR